MKTTKILLSTLLILAIALPSYSQLKVVTDGKVGIGTTTPEAKLDVNGDAILRSGSLLMGQTAGAADARIEIGYERASDGHAYFDMIADAAAYPDFGVRLIRFPNGFSRFDHRGNGPLQFLASDAGTILLATQNTERMRVTNGGQIHLGTFGALGPELLEVNGNAAKIGGGSWVGYSDKRLKKNIHPYTDGLKEIMEIKPVVYQYNGKLGIKDTEKEYVGVVAQDLQKVAPYMVQSNTYTEYATEGEGATYKETVKSKDEYLSVDPSAMTYMLINAVQEQQKTIENLEERLARLEAVLHSHNGGTNGGINTQSTTLNEMASLSQNQPNPFDQTTLIEYFVPDNARSAFIQVFDMNGKMMKKIEVGMGRGNVQIHAGTLSAGTYSYSLFVDGAIVDTKKMTLTK